MSTWYNNATVRELVSNYFGNNPGHTTADMIRYMAANATIKVPSKRHTYRVVARMMDTPALDYRDVGLYKAKWSKYF